MLPKLSNIYRYELISLSKNKKRINSYIKISNWLNQEIDSRVGRYDVEILHCLNSLFKYKTLTLQPIGATTLIIYSKIGRFGIDR